jgi:3',5'-cyclic AMP phosphodiesterase CpdA
VRLVGLDSLVPGVSYGALSTETLDFLDTALAVEPAVLTIVFLHHPPFASGIKHMKRIGLQVGAERLREIVCLIHPH